MLYSDGWEDNFDADDSDPADEDPTEEEDDLDGDL